MDYYHTVLIVNGKLCGGFFPTHLQFKGYQGILLRRLNATIHYWF